MYDLIVAGGGPAGMVSGLLFARAGCRVLVLEKHADFFRDFRGDTVHPSTMEILQQLGLLDRFLRRTARSTVLNCAWPGGIGGSVICLICIRPRRSSR